MAHAIQDMKFAGIGLIDEESLEPGDLVFGKSDKGFASRWVSRLNGFWSHVAVYVGEEKVAHSTVPGQIIEPLGDFVGHYPAGVGCARPFRENAELRIEAARWAQENAIPVEDVKVGDRMFKKIAGIDRYGFEDLGLAAAVMLRASARQFNHKWFLGDEALDFDKETVELQLAMREKADFFRYRRKTIRFDDLTCAGFAYTAFVEARDSKTRIDPKFIPGVRRLRAQYLVFDPDKTPLKPEDVSLGLMLAELPPTDSFDRFRADSSRLFGSALDELFDSGASALSAEKFAQIDVGTWNQNRYLARKVFRHSIWRIGYAPLARLVFPEKVAVGPNDLWMSADVEPLGFLGELPPQAAKDDISVNGVKQ